jgi:tetratricopeptide (TPR) repeat protein
MNLSAKRAELAWLPLVVAALAAIYLPSLGNALVYDDSYLNEDLFKEYSSLFPLRVRILSYGSFVWLHALFGDGWWKQRLFNVLLHLGTVAALWAFYREILRHVTAPSGDGTSDYHASPALGVAVGFFALNPVAVYGVAYLIQRSIVMATLFTVLALWSFARGLRLGQPRFHALAVVFYVLAVMSKEHAVLAPLAAIPVYIIVARPAPRRLALLAACGAALVALAAAILYLRYGEILGKPFDEYSRLYLDQLARLDPDAPKHAWALSIINQAWLFFRYGVEWVIPWSGWMSINLRPPFPLHWLTFPQILGVIGYAGALAGGFVLLLRCRDGRALVGFSFVVAALLFATEFATVWVQDPFSLYRSYLWAIGIPGLAFFALHGPSPRVLLMIGGVLGGLLVWQSLDRVISLSTPESVWSDAIAKQPDDPRSVGRWFPYLNRGAAYVERDQYRLALHDFEVSSSLGDEGMGTFNIGSILATRGDPQRALEMFDRAEKEGYSLYNLHFQRGMALLALNRVPEGYDELMKTLYASPGEQVRRITLLQMGRAAIQMQRVGEAINALQQLVAVEPQNREGRYLLGMAYVMNKQPDKAKQTLDALAEDAPTASVFYARALASYGLQHKADALADIERAMRMGLDNPNVRDWAAKIRAMP